MATRMYQSYQGPTDPNLRHSEIEGYQPVSRIGEVVINSFGAPCPARTCTCTLTAGAAKGRRAFYHVANF